MPDVLFFLAGVSFTLTVVLLAAVGRKLYQMGRRIADLERRANPASRHDWKAIERHDLGEAALFDLAAIETEAEYLRERLNQAIRRAQHVAAGGHPDDPASKWLKPQKD